MSNGIRSRPVVSDNFVNKFKDFQKIKEKCRDTERLGRVVEGGGEKS